MIPIKHYSMCSVMWHCMKCSPHISCVLQPTTVFSPITAKEGDKIIVSTDCYLALSAHLVEPIRNFVQACHDKTLCSSRDEVARCNHTFPRMHLEYLASPPSSDYFFRALAKVFESQHTIVEFSNPLDYKLSRGSYAGSRVSIFWGDEGPHCVPVA